MANFERGGLNDNYRKRRRVECGMAQLTPAGQSVAKNGAEKLTGVEKDEHQVCEKYEQNGCGMTQLEMADQSIVTELACGVQQKCGSDKVYRCNLTKPKLSRQSVEKVEVYECGIAQQSKMIEKQELFQVLKNVESYTFTYHNKSS